METCKAPLKQHAALRWCHCRYSCRGMRRYSFAPLRAQLLLLPTSPLRKPAAWRGRRPCCCCCPAATEASQAAAADAAAAAPPLRRQAKLLPPPISANVSHAAAAPLLLTQAIRITRSRLLPCHPVPFSTCTVRWGPLLPIIRHNNCAEGL